MLLKNHLGGGHYKRNRGNDTMGEGRGERERKKWTFTWLDAPSFIVALRELLRAIAFPNALHVPPHLTLFSGPFYFISSDASISNR